MTASLQDFGLVPFFARQLSPEELEQGRVGRVIEVQRALIRITDGAQERSIPLTSRWAETASEQRPTVGDWVVLDEQGVRVERVLDRKSVFRRVAAGDKAEIQLIAANIDILFVVTSCNEEFKESRLERYLALAAEAGVIPVVVLTKIDLTDDLHAYVARARSVQHGLAVEAVNALDSDTFGGITAWIERGSTIALVGSSGVGKSTILNTLTGISIAATSEIREDDKKGRHTTTHRQLHQLPGGGLLIDVPGMRELRVAEIDTALATVFDDIEALASKCRFADCHHEAEPGCAVRAAIERGDLDERRLSNYLKLLRENARHNASLAERRSQSRARGRLYRQILSMKDSEKGRS
jgi:ribosome biogenesis GTPase